MRTPGECNDCEATISQRDRAEEVADALADAISRFLGVEIGEHVGGSPGNCPWSNALEAIKSAQQTHGLYRLTQHGEKCGCSECT